MTPPQAPMRPEPAALRAVGRIVAWLTGAAIRLAGVAILVALALIGWSVVMRYVFQSPPVWVDDAVGFLLIAIVTLAAAQVLRRGEHIGVDILTARLGPRGQRWSRAWTSLATLAVSLILIVNGWQSAMFSKSLGIVSEGHLEWPVYLLMLFMPLAGLLMLLVSVESLLRVAAGAPDLGAHEHGPGERE